MPEALYDARSIAAQVLALPQPDEGPSVAGMTGDLQANFYLPGDLRQSAKAGNHNFIGKIESVLRESGMHVRFCDPLDARRMDTGYSLFHMQDPLNAKGVTIRRTYFYPFWQIERSNQRWDWDIAKAQFELPGGKRGEAEQFFSFWQSRLYKDALKDVSNDGFVYVPLQGRLLERRSFQECSPIRMLKHVIAAESKKRVIATLHPKEHYEADEIQVLEKLENEVPHLEIRVGDMETLLARCAYIVTQNSSAAFSGLFFRKPSVLFAKVDFHHISANVSQLGVKEAFDQVQHLKPDYAGYVWWFLQRMSINAGRPEAKEKIRTRLLEMGWPV